MRYSQPFGTPTPPLGVYPRFINGNPVTGTEGSIPPATAFDEDQIEIITVIQNAGLTPDHNDLTQLWQALQNMIGQKYITSPIVKHVHGAGADFIDLNQAMAWLASYIITPSGYVTFLVAPGRWTYTVNVELNHVNMSRVAIQGGALLGGAPQGSNMSVTGYGNSADGTNQIIYLRSIYATELSFTGGITGFTVLRGGCILRYLLVTGSQSVGTKPPGAFSGYSGWGSGLECYDKILIDGCSFWGFGMAGFYCIGGSVQCYTSLNCAISFCQQGIVNYGGFIFIQCSEFIITSSYGVQGVAIFQYPGFFISGAAYIAGNNPGVGLGAITIENGGNVWIGGGTVTTNGGWGQLIAGAGEIVMERASVTYNSGGGLDCVGTSTCFITDSGYSGNGGYGIVGSGNVYIDASRSSVQSWVMSPDAVFIL